MSFNFEVFTMLAFRAFPMMEIKQDYKFSDIFWFLLAFVICFFAVVFVGFKVAENLQASLF